MKEREKIVNHLLEEIHGRFIPTFYWENHEPMEYWYDPIKDTICVDTGDEMKIKLKNAELTYDSLFKILDDLELYLMKKYKLYMPED